MRVCEQILSLPDKSGMFGVHPGVLRCRRLQLRPEPDADSDGDDKANSRYRRHADSPRDSITDANPNAHGDSATDRDTKRHALPKSYDCTAMWDDTEGRLPATRNYTDDPEG